MSTKPRVPTEFKHEDDAIPDIVNGRVLIETTASDRVFITERTGACCFN